jgi:hypothetical protein
MSIESIDGHGIFRIGSVLRPAWRLFAGDILFFLFVPAVIYGSMVIAFVIFGSVFAFAGWTSGSSGVADLGMVIGRVAALSLTMVGQGVLLLVAFQRLRGQPLRATEVLKTVLSRLLPLLGLSILWSLGLVLPVLGGALVVERLATGLGSVTKYCCYCLRFTPRRRFCWSCGPWSHRPASSKAWDRSAA